MSINRNYEYRKEMVMITDASTLGLPNLDNLAAGVKNATDISSEIANEAWQIVKLLHLVNYQKLCILADDAIMKNYRTQIMNICNDFLRLAAQQPIQPNRQKLGDVWRQLACVFDTVTMCTRCQSVAQREKFCRFYLHDVGNLAKNLSAIHHHLTTV